MKIIKIMSAVMLTGLAPLSLAQTEQYPSQVFFGDTHVHSNLSTDAAGFGVKLGPDEAYRFAAGETVKTTWGLTAKMDRPLDFMVLSDHAESYGLIQLVREADPRMLVDPEVKEWSDMFNGSAEDQQAIQSRFYVNKFRRKVGAKLNSLSTPELNLDVWNKALNIAEKHNRPGEFTAMLGYEWTAMVKGDNLHRVVIYRDGPDKVGKMAPLSATASPDPMDLWKVLGHYEEKTGGKVLAIPHNGNLSNGLMFPQTGRVLGKKVSKEYFAQRARWEPLYEVTQIKGDGEAYPLLSPDDEFADYETWDFGNFATIPKTPDMFAKEYPRSAMAFGLAEEQRSGVNPYKFGLIGSSDSHTGLVAVEENNFYGKHSGLEPDGHRWDKIVGKGDARDVRGWQMASSGYAAVWAQENTRESLWDAMMRKEVYATTGTRMTVRFFGGWNYTDKDLTQDIAAAGYSKGVPMGADLPKPTEQINKAPTFMIAVAKDAMGANLDRVQVIKGWADADGKAHEKIYNVAWSDERKLDVDGKLPPVKNTVDVTAATWENSVGATELTTVWTDPDFDAGTAAFYYVRVLEIPTPRWTAYDAKRYQLELPPEVEMTTQERAYTSPIWYRAE